MRRHKARGVSFGPTQTKEFTMSELICIEAPEEKVNDERQATLEFWGKGFDPNLPASWIYECRLDPIRARKALEKILLPKKMEPVVVAELGANTLRLHASSSKDDFTASTVVPLCEASALGRETIRFTAPLNKILATCECQARPFDLRFNRKEGLLVFATEDPKGSIAMRSNWIETPKKVELKSLGHLQPKALHRATRFAGAFRTCKSPSTFPYSGTLIAGGTVSSGYVRAASQARLVGLEGCEPITLPREQFLNGLKLFRGLVGEAEILESTSRIHVRTPELEGSWAKAGDWPASLKRVFDDEPVTDVFSADADEFFSFSRLPIAALETVNIAARVENDGIDLYLSGVANAAFSWMRIWAVRETETKAGTGTLWKTAVPTADLQLALEAIMLLRPSRIRFSLTQRALMIEPVGVDGEFRTVLVRTQPS